MTGTTPMHFGTKKGRVGVVKRGSIPRRGKGGGGRRAGLRPAPTHKSNAFVGAGLRSAHVGSELPTA